MVKDISRNIQDNYFNTVGNWAAAMGLTSELQKILYYAEIGEKIDLLFRENRVEILVNPVYNYEEDQIVSVDYKICDLEELK